MKKKLFLSLILLVSGSIVASGTETLSVRWEMSEAPIIHSMGIGVDWKADDDLKGCRKRLRGDVEEDVRDMQRSDNGSEHVDQGSLGTVRAGIKNFIDPEIMKMLEALEAKEELQKAASSAK